MQEQHDLVVRGGTLVDGTGVPRYRADVAVKNGRVSMISGRIPAGSAKEIDASGCIVAPGAIDMHTHYDGQLNWDPLLHAIGVVRGDLAIHRTMWFRLCAHPCRGPRAQHGDDESDRGDSARLDAAGYALGLGDVSRISRQVVTYFTLAEYNAFDYMPNWVQPLIGTPRKEPRSCAILTFVRPCAKMPKQCDCLGDPRECVPTGVMSR